MPRTPFDIAGKGQAAKRKIVAKIQKEVTAKLNQPEALAKGGGVHGKSAVHGKKVM